MLAQSLAVSLRGRASAHARSFTRCIQPNGEPVWSRPQRPNYRVPRGPSTRQTGCTYLVQPCEPHGMPFASGHVTQLTPCFFELRTTARSSSRSSANSSSRTTAT